MTASRLSRVLIVRLSAHGDVIQTLPLLSALKRARPDLFIGWLIEESAAPLLERHPLIDRLHVVPRKSWLRRLRHLPAHPREAFHVAKDVGAMRAELRAMGYDASFDVQGLLKSAIWPAFAGIPQRWGYAGVREQAWRLYTNRLGAYDLRACDRPTVFQFMEFVSALGVSPPDASEKARDALDFPMPPLSSQAQAAADLLLREIPSQRPLIALAPATLWASKRWPESHWRALIEMLAQRSATIALLGSSADADACQALIPLTTDATVCERPAFCLNLAGKTDWPVLAAVLSRCDLLVGPDSAPLHLAQALASGNPQRRPRIVGLYGPTSEGRTGPIQREHRVCVSAVSCRPCFERACPLTAPQARDACMRQLSPSMAIDAIDAQLRALSLLSRESG
ncbi:MAG: glycosyltransferase family 9 protein [Vampirovibrionales bacterium]|nr:glycosyltransferase family 9 protein [Vampirovibrionales bacterium]